MPELRNCANCGHAVSSSVKQCPKCHSPFVFGSVCKICGRSSTAKDGIEWPPNSRDGLKPSTLYHTACADAVLPNFQPHCIVCGADLCPDGGNRYSALQARPYESPYGESDPCHSCGERNPFGFLISCAKCRFALPQSDMSKPPKGIFGERYVHRYCARWGCLGVVARLIE